MLHCKFKSITLPKLGNSVSENEDSIFEPSEIKSDTMIRFAISDGATEYSYSKEWASLLVNGYGKMSFDKANLFETVKKISGEWQLMIPPIEELSLFCKAKVKQGTSAAFLGLTIDCEKHSFETIAVGDCVLFQIRSYDLCFSFPISSVEDFNNTPNLIRSNEKYQTNLEEKAVYYNGIIQPKDIFFLVTDALAALILGQSKHGNKVWKHLIKMFETQNEICFENWINKLRKEKKIKNDDVTILMIKTE
jgi:hypothetical protein